MVISQKQLHKLNFMLHKGDFMYNRLLFIIIIMLVTVFSCTREQIIEPVEIIVSVQEEISLIQEEINQQIEDNELSNNYQENIETEINFVPHNFSVVNNVIHDPNRPVSLNHSSLHISENEMIFEWIYFNPRSDLYPGETYERYDITQEIVDNMLYINFFYDGTFMGHDTAWRIQKRLLALYLDGYIINLHSRYDEVNIQKRNLSEDTLVLSSRDRSGSNGGSISTGLGFFQFSLC